MASFGKLVLCFIFVLINEMNSAHNIFIRVTQVGFAEDEVKQGVIITNEDIDGSDFVIVDASSKETLYKSVIGMNFGRYGKFDNSYRFDFTDFTQRGEFRIKVKGIYSNKFKIGKGLYLPVAQRLLEFFKIQRCGYTNPSYHDV